MSDKAGAEAGAWARFFKDWSLEVWLGVSNCLSLSTVRLHQREPNFSRGRSGPAADLMFFQRQYDWLCSGIDACLTLPLQRLTTLNDE